MPLGSGMATVTPSRSYRKLAGHGIHSGTPTGCNRFHHCRVSPTRVSTRRPGGTRANLAGARTTKAVEDGDDLRGRRACRGLPRHREPGRQWPARVGGEVRARAQGRRRTELHTEPHRSHAASAEFRGHRPRAARHREPLLHLDGAWRRGCRPGRRILRRALQHRRGSGEGGQVPRDRDLGEHGRRHPRPGLRPQRPAAPASRRAARSSRSTAARASTSTAS